MLLDLVVLMVMGAVALGASFMTGVLIVAALNTGSPQGDLPHPFGGIRPGAIPRGKHEKPRDDGETEI